MYEDQGQLQKSKSSHIAFINFSLDIPPSFIQWLVVGLLSIWPFPSTYLGKKLERYSFVHSITWTSRPYLLQVKPQQISYLKAHLGCGHWGNPPSWPLALHLMMPSHHCTGCTYSCSAQSVLLGFMAIVPFALVFNSAGV